MHPVCTDPLLKNSIYNFREGPPPRGAPSVPPFCFPLSLRLSLKALQFEPFLRKNLCKTCSRKHHTNLKNRMAVLRNRRPPRMHPGCTDPLLKTPEYSSVHSCKYQQLQNQSHTKFSTHTQLLTSSRLGYQQDPTQLRIVSNFSTRSSKRFSKCP